MKKYILTLIITISIAKVVLGQTKTETEDWINSKMSKLINRSVSDNSKYITGTPGFSATTTLKAFNLRDGMMSYSYEISYYSFGSLSKEIIRGENIHIKYLQEIKTFDINHDNYRLELKFDNYFDIDVISDNDTKDFNVDFKIYKLEDNLGERFAKAFKHYKGFYPTPNKSKETF